jgi:capsular polysaccharide biosynthesis protein
LLALLCCLIYSVLSTEPALLRACASLQVAELSELPFYPDQVSLLMRTGVLMGVHGAGLANQVFMRPRLGAVVEVRLLPAY